MKEKQECSHTPLILEQASSKNVLLCSILSALSALFTTDGADSFQSPYVHQAAKLRELILRERRYDGSLTLSENINQFMAAIKSGSSLSAFGVPRPVTGFQPGPAE